MRLHKQRLIAVVGPSPPLGSGLGLCPQAAPRSRRLALVLRDTSNPDRIERRCELDWTADAFDDRPTSFPGIPHAGLNGCTGDLPLNMADRFDGKTPSQDRSAYETTRCACGQRALFEIDVAFMWAACLAPYHAVYPNHPIFIEIEEKARAMWLARIADMFYAQTPISMDTLRPMMDRVMDYHIACHMQKSNRMPI